MFIYGAKMVAEYHPVDNKYYYYTTDQINSTRVVTDGLGNVVYKPGMLFSNGAK
ncbi:MAG TPA: hypothetical protein P5523_07155 [Bacteroidales bacterium]|mgnify:CR=1 FL=1|nr:hypothetical protein [Bacteroidales bacterium]